MSEEKQIFTSEFQELIDNADNYLNDSMIKYSKSVKDLLKLNDFNIQEKAMIAPQQHQALVQCLFGEKSKLKKLKQKYEEKIEELSQINGQVDPTQLYINKKEAHKREDMKKLSLLIDEQAELIKYLEEMCDILKAFGYSIKNAVELIKLGNI